MGEKNSTDKRNFKKQTRWGGLFVSEYAWDYNNDIVTDPQPMLSADEQGAIMDMLIVANERKCTVFIQSWQDRHFHYYRCTIRKVDHKKWNILYEDVFGEHQLAIGMITSIHMLD